MSKEGGMSEGDGKEEGRVMSEDSGGRRERG